MQRETLPRPRYVCAVCGEIIRASDDLGGDITIPNRDGAVYHAHLDCYIGQLSGGERAQNGTVAREAAQDDEAAEAEAEAWL
jgi:hypothetical protein